MPTVLASASCARSKRTEPPSRVCGCYGLGAIPGPSIPRPRSRRLSSFAPYCERRSPAQASCPLRASLYPETRDRHCRWLSQCRISCGRPAGTGPINPGSRTRDDDPRRTSGVMGRHKKTGRCRRERLTTARPDLKGRESADGGNERVRCITFYRCTRGRRPLWNRRHLLVGDPSALRFERRCRRSFGAPRFVIEAFGSLLASARSAIQ
jgi:hypothetical protein